MMYLKILMIGLCLGGGTQNRTHVARDGSQMVRLVDHHRYQVVDSAGFYLYSIRKLVQGEKIARVETVYYFSVGAVAPVKELTRANLEDAFAGNACFRYHLEAQFHSDKALMDYDQYLRMYKIKWIYGLCSGGVSERRR